MCFLMQLEVMAMHKRILWALGNGAARRTLFGPVDREQLQLEYRDALRRDLEEASRRWGFDFATETPLVGGDFQWEGVSGVKVPVLYRAERPQNPEEIQRSPAERGENARKEDRAEEETDQYHR
ncbi:cyclin-dependent kinase inhibitor 1-like isoform X3 [Sinocyclocheilus rhinocerous]|uniref:cyclin-dependent kinase inhibitor 1-like isoform X3 n=1 Tax=Sinocyclocheilus rhinocerous TaxID=307959 RepID=UPI0007B7BCAF|nr:PREDICTED: cyclin-dependent kinase inhibitor 1-like isoform X3 [Sinocyclocheilus rhinocerous]